MKKRKLTYQTILDLCKDRNWTTLETEYINAATSMRWQCNVCKFIWSSSYSNTQNRKKCSRCQKGSYRYSEEEVIKVAESKRFELVGQYTRSDKKHTWRCMDCKYEWMTAFANINREWRGTGCPKCHNAGRYKYEDILRIAKEKNLTCLDTEYKHCNIPMKWKCNRCEREWETTFRSIRQNIGCIKCSFDDIMKLDLEDVKKSIQDRNMICLDTKYINSHCKMNWQCLVCDNTWEASYTHVKHSNSGCPNCAAYKSQKTCRKIFEELMGGKFPTLRPKFLKGLEYDGYNKDLKLAFEYQGLQHYKFIPFFQKDISNFDKLLQNDEEKKKLSKQNGITLIEIPFTYTHKNYDKLYEYILTELERTEFIFLYKP